MKSWPVPLILLILLLLSVTSCGEGGDERSAGIVHRLLSAGLEDPDRLESFPGELPPDLPEDVPIYPDGDIIVSSRELRTPPDAVEEPGAGDPVLALFLVLIDTTDPAADVLSYYEKALDEDPWQVESTGATTSRQSIRFSLIADPDVTGIADITSGGDDGRTTIALSIQDAGAEQIKDSEFEVPDGLAAPAQFPEDIPLYEGGIILTSAFIREPGQESIEVSFIIQDTQADVIDFYRSAFDAMGWETEDATGGGLGDRIIFSDPENTLNGAIEADRFTEDRDYTRVVITLQQDSNREPGEAAPTPDGEAPDDPTAES